MGLLNKILGRRELVLYAFSATICSAFLMGKLAQDQFMAIAVMVVGFYFGQRSNVPTDNGSVVAELQKVKEEVLKQ